MVEDNPVPQYNAANNTSIIKAGAKLDRRLRPYERSRCAEHEEVVGALGVVVCPPHRG